MCFNFNFLRIKINDSKILCEQQVNENCQLPRLTKIAYRSNFLRVNLRLDVSFNLESKTPSQKHFSLAGWICFPSLANP